LFSPPSDKNSLTSSSRSALTDQPLVTLIYAIVSLACGAGIAIVPDSVSELVPDSDCLETLKTTFLGMLPETK
jgi:hypothetical protein